MKDAETPLLEIRGLTVAFEKDGKLLRALDDVSLKIHPGEIVGLVGQSGSGKTTLAASLFGLTRGSPGIVSGEILFEGRALPPRARALRGRELSLVFQEPRAALAPYFSVGEHMLEALRRAGAKGGTSELRARGEEFLRDAGLENPAQLWGLYAYQLSGGMAQRVMIAMALCAKPKLLVADEPSTALDVTTQAKLLELFRHLRDHLGLSILLISHDLRVVRETCSRVYVLHQGKVVEEGETAQVLQFPRHAYTASLLNAFQSLVPQARPVNGAPLLEVRGLSKAFRREGKAITALDSVSLTLHAGETYGLVGESGAGKSTLALSLLALQGVDGGEVRYQGEDLLRAGKKRLRQLRREVRLLFQHPEAVLNGGMRVFSILAEGLEKDGNVGRAEIRARVFEALEQVRLDPAFAERYPANLSAGEKQRVTLARALITRPRLLVCDEPVASLDLAIQAGVLELFRDLQKRQGLAFLFISHNLDWIRLLAHRVGILHAGQIVEEGPVQDFTLERARHPYTRLLLASELTSPG